MVLDDYVVQQAMDMFLSQGIKSVRMDDVARQCGISKRTLYEMISSREALVELCLERYMSRFRKELGEVAARGRNVIEEFWLVFEKCDEYYDTNIRLSAELKKTYPNLLEKLVIHEKKESAEQTLMKLQQGVDDGFIENYGDLQFIADIMSGYFYGLSSIELKERKYDYKMNRHDSFMLAVMIFFRGITTEKGRKYIDERLMKLNNK